MAVPSKSVMPVLTSASTRRLIRSLSSVVFCALWSAMSVGHAQGIRFAPLDEAAEQSDWRAYRRGLLTALEARDHKSLVGAIDPNVDNGPDQRAGLEEFQRRWSVEDQKSPLWRELSKAVSLGGAFVKDGRGQMRYCAPYVAARWPTDYDPFRFGAVVSEDVLVKSEPSSGARTVARLSYELVAVEDWEVADTTPGFPQKWTKIRIREASGFIPEEQIRSPIEHMACFSRQGGTWRLVSFTAGYLPE